MTDPIQIREMQRQDLPQIQELYRDLVPEGVAMEMLTQNYETAAGDSDYYLVTAVRGEKVLGSATGIVCLALDAPFLVIENVVVDGACRGQGIGRKILEELDCFAAARSCQYALLVSSGFRREAHSFYEAMGYTDDVRGFRKYYDTAAGSGKCILTKCSKDGIIIE